MSDELLHAYKNLMRLIESAKGREGHENIKDLYQGWINTIEVFNKYHPDLKRRYEQHKAMYASFSPEQIDHICYQIGEWYLMMKPLLEGQHNLGYMKEQLKTMICGD